MSLIHSKHVAQPSDTSAFDFHDKTLATSFSVKFLIRGLIWPEDAADFSETPIVEGLEFTHVRLHDTPALRTIQQDRFDVLLCPIVFTDKTALVCQVVHKLTWLTRDCDRCSRGCI